MRTLASQALETTGVQAVFRCTARCLCLMRAAGVARNSSPLYGIAPDRLPALHASGRKVRPCAERSFLASAYSSNHITIVISMFGVRL